MTLADLIDPVPPDDVLIEAYRTVAKAKGCSREKLLAETSNVDLIRAQCGERWSHCRIDAIRARITNLAKRGEAPVFTSDSGPKTGHGVRLEVAANPEYQAYLLSDEWHEKSNEVKSRAGYRCQLCNSDRSLQAHHRTYANVKTDAEIEDCICLCKTCHRGFHEKILPKHWTLFSSEESDE